MAEPSRGIGAALAEARRKAERSLLRDHERDGASVSNLELFFDLVYVFAVTQLSHYLLSDLSWLRAFQTTVLFGAVWWAWMYTTWATNWIDPDRAPNRLVIGLAMLASLLMACALPYAFSYLGWVFAGAYLAIQIGRTLYVSWAMGEWRRNDRYSLLRIAIWFGVSAIPWLAGSLASDAETRAAWWVAALAIDYSGPFVFYWVPVIGASRAEDWRISGHHMAERCGLFIIIALGEGLIITGATYAGAPPTSGLTSALVITFLGSFAMWWIYFDLGARRGAEHIEKHENPGLIARQAFTYWHIPIVGGIILVAVADELVMAHPLEPAHAEFAFVLGAGMALFLWGVMSFKRISSGRPWYPASHTSGLALVAMMTLAGLLLHPPHLAMSAIGTVIFGIVALWEWGSFHGGWIERMEARGWWLGAVLRRRAQFRIAQYERQEKTADPRG